jgi:hypothetical protein
MYRCDMPCDMRTGAGRVELEMVEEAALRVCGQRHSGKAMRAQSTPLVQSAPQ